MSGACRHVTQPPRQRERVTRAARRVPRAVRGIDAGLPKILKESAGRFSWDFPMTPSYRRRAGVVGVLGDFGSGTDGPNRVRGPNQDAIERPGDDVREI